MAAPFESRLTGEEWCQKSPTFAFNAGFGGANQLISNGLFKHYFANKVLNGYIPKYLIDLKLYTCGHRHAGVSTEAGGARRGTWSQLTLRVVATPPRGPACLRYIAPAFKSQLTKRSSALFIFKITYSPIIL
jgi:hypothetical protein